MLAAGGLDAASICTPPALHTEMTIACAEYGYPVLVGKPMATSLADSDQMIATARAADTLLMVAHNRRFSERHRIASKSTLSPNLANPTRTRCLYPRRLQQLESQPDMVLTDRACVLGVMADLGSHKLDLLR